MTAARMGRRAQWDTILDILARFDPDRGGAG
jgi:hypothetical protein